MADLIIANPGQINGAGDRLALFLKNFAGEVITAFERSSVTKGRHMERTITSGKSASFPILGRTKAQYLAPGKSLDDQRKTILSAETIIMIDGLLTADQLITDIDDAMSHFEVSGEYSKQLGEALAVSADCALLAEIAKMVVANGSNLVELGKPSIVAKTAPVGTPLVSAVLGALYLEALLEMKYNLDMNFVPASERTAYITPDVELALVNAKLVISGDYDTNGSLKEGTVGRVAGFDLVPCPMMTQGGADGLNVMQGDGHIFPVAYKDNCKILACHRSAVGTLKLMELGMEHARRAEYQADQIIAKYAMGHKGIRPEATQMCTMTLA